MEYLDTTTKKVIAFIVASILCVIIIASCTPSPVVQPAVVAQSQVVQPSVVQPQVVQAAPVVVQQAPAHDGFLTGMLMGHLMSGGSRSTTVVEHHTTVAPAPQYAATAPAQRYAAPVVRPAPTFTAPARPPVARTVTSTPNGGTRISVGKSRR